jgi:hypothetical protein
MLRTSNPRVPSECGVALLIVLMLITLVTTVVVEFQYNSRVDYQLAANARDVLQAEYNAMSAMEVRALILRESRKLRAALAGLWKALGGGQGELPMASILEMIPIECGLLGAMLKPLDRLEGETDDRGILPGECLATSQSEHSKIALNMLASPGQYRDIQQQLLGMLLDLTPIRPRSWWGPWRIG